MRRKYLLAVTILSTLSVCATAQNWEVNWEGTANALYTTGEFLPFWARTNNDGIFPYATSGVLTAGADIRYGDSKGWGFEAGTNLVGGIAQGTSYSSKGVYGLVDRLYASGSWKMLHLDVGMKPRARELTDLSISGGNVMYSRNARNMPGINAWTDWIYFEKGHWVGIKANYAHYQMIDNRYVTNALVHNKSVALKVALGRKVDLSFGFEHWAQWGGNSPKYGEQPATFKDYMRIVLGMGGGDGATASDQLNVLGNHLGKEYVRVDWRAKDFTMTFQYDKPFEDGSGMRFQNAPDGIWSLQFSLNNREQWVTDVIYEFITTTWQSGTAHDRPATKEEMANQNPDSPYYGKIVIGGCDNYFGNGEYRSGWTYYNRIIGLPLLLPSAPNEEGITMGMASTRVRAHHFGIKGIAFKKLPYKFLATYSRNYGRYHQGDESFFASKPQQFSLALEADFGQRLWKKELPIAITLGLYADFGQVYQDCFGFTVKFSYLDRHRF